MQPDRILSLHPDAAVLLDGVRVPVAATEIPEPVSGRPLPGDVPARVGADHDAAPAVSGQKSGLHALGGPAWAAGGYPALDATTPATAGQTCQGPAGVGFVSAREVPGRIGIDHAGANRCEQRNGKGQVSA